MEIQELSPHERTTEPEMWSRVRNYRGEQGDPRNLIWGFVLFGFAVGTVIQVLMQISGHIGVVPAVTLFLLIFHVWSLMIRLRRDQRR